MAGKKKFVQQVAHLFRGQVLFAIAQFGVLALLTHFGGKTQTGLYVLGLVTTAPIYLFFDLNLRVIRSTDQEHDENFVSYIGLRTWCLVIATIVSLAVGYGLFADRFAIFVVIAAYRIGDSLSNLAFGGFQRVQQSDLIGKTLSIKGPISLVAVLIVTWLSGGSAVLTGLVMATISIYFGLFRDIPAAWKLNQPESPVSVEAVKSAMSDMSSNVRIAKRALPLGFDACISSLALNMPQYCVEAFFGTAALGVFGLLMRLAYSIQMLVGAVGHTGVSVLAKLRQDNSRPQFWRLFNRMMGTSVAVGAIAVIGGTLVLPKVLGYLLGANYDQPWLLATLLIASCLTGAQRTAGRATQSCNQFFAYASFDVIIFSTSFIASWFLVANYKLHGAATSLALAFGIGLAVTLAHTWFLLWPDSNKLSSLGDRVMRGTETTGNSKST